MADEVILRDQNSVIVGAGVTDDANQDITMFRVDPVTSYLLIDVNATTSSSANDQQIAKRDQNNTPVCLAWNESEQKLEEVLTDENGYILCDIG